MDIQPWGQHNYFSSICVCVSGDMVGVEDFVNTYLQIQIYNTDHTCILTKFHFSTWITLAFFWYCYNNYLPLFPNVLPSVILIAIILNLKICIIFICF